MTGLSFHITSQCLVLITCTITDLCYNFIFLLFKSYVTHSMFSCLQLADKPLNLGQETLVLSQQLDAVVAVAVVVVVVATGALVNTARTVRVVHIICGWLTIPPRQSLK